MFDFPKVLRGLTAPLPLLVFALHPLAGHACTATAPDVVSVGNTAVDSSCNYGSIQAAVNAATCPIGTNIVLNKSGDYTNQHVTITNKNISLIGRVDTSKCNTLVAACGINFPCPVGPLQTINGKSGAVVTVRGTSNVNISHLTITGGNATSGGGIDYAGIGTMQIDNSTIFSNAATYGGGIRFQGNGGAADLYLNTNTSVTSNTAQSSGGGIRIEGQAALHADSPQTFIAFNEALGTQGGGLLVVGPAYAHIGSPGYLAGAVIYQNTAPYGGGIALISEIGGPATADLLASDPTKPVRLEQNRATRTGGGVYLLSYAHMEGSGAVPQETATLQMEGARIDDNAGQEGSGIYADTFYTTADFPAGSEVYMYTGASCGTGTECNSVSGNRAVDVNDNSTSGSAILIQTDGVLRARQLAMRGNEGAHAVRVVDSLHLPLLLDTCLLADNTLYAELLTLGIASATINQCTIAGNMNVAEGYAMLRANADLTLINSIFAQGTQQTLLNTDAGATMNLDYLLSGETDSLSTGTHIDQASATFVDAGNGDFHLSLHSPGIDVAPPVAGDDRDLDNRPRDQDLLDVPNQQGPRDLGAYERQGGVCDASDTIFCTGFELP
jgi:hypothetical protein